MNILDTILKFLSQIKLELVLITTAIVSGLYLWIVPADIRDQYRHISLLGFILSSTLLVVLIGYKMYKTKQSRNKLERKLRNLTTSEKVVLFGYLLSNKREINFFNENLEVVARGLEVRGFLSEISSYDYMIVDEIWNYFHKHPEKIDKYLKTK